MPNMGLNAQKYKINKADYLFKSTNAREEGWAIKVEMCREELKGAWLNDALYRLTDRR